MVIQQDGLECSIPLEDIWAVILETRQAQVSSALFSAFCEAGVVLITCDQKHNPNGMLLPIAPNCRFSEIVESQLSMSKPLRKRLWQRIVKTKIENQSRVLELLGKDPQRLMMFSADVRSGDTTNREGSAAAAYFSQLLPLGGRHGSVYSDALDYGYMVLRAGVARSVVSGGWLPSRGINHCNKLNPFNLVDDLIEYFRPIVDLIVTSYEISGELTPEKKAVLASIFEYMVLIDGDRYSLQTAIEETVRSLRPAIEQGDVKLLRMPAIIGLETIREE